MQGFAFEQLSVYMENAVVKEGWLVLFDYNPNKSWDKKLSWVNRELKNGYKIYLVGC